MPNRSVPRDGMAAGIALAAMLLGLWLPSKLVVSTSPSLDHRVFLRLDLAMEREQDRGEYLIFQYQDSDHIHQGLHQDNDLLIKQVGCRPGERLLVGDGRASCQGISLGTQLETDGQGRALRHFTYDGIVPPGKYFMIGKHERSYDSRYFGFIDASQFRQRALPLW